MTDLLEARSAAFDRGAGVIAGSKRWASPLDLACALDPQWRRTPALEVVNEALVWADVTPGARLMVFMAPQEGKSELCSHYGPLWSLIRNPRKRIGVASYDLELARGFAEKTRDNVRDYGEAADIDLGLRLSRSNKAANRWRCTSGGGMVAAGVRTGLTGKPLDDLRIDDPFADREDANSDASRRVVWNFWQGTAVPRLATGAPVLLVMTRWHHDDLAGRFEKHYPGMWRVVHIPAQADPEILDPDPLGRAPGEYMISARGRSRADWDERKREMGDEWVPLAQGSPAKPGGEMFDVSKLRHWRWNRDRTGIVCEGRTWRLDPAVRDLWPFITIDTAFSTKASADWTVASCWAVALDGSLILLDVARARVPAHQQIDVARPLVDRWRPLAVYAEASSRSTLLVRAAVTAGWQIRDLVADKDKVTRAAPFARKVQYGAVWLPGGPDGIEADGPLLDYIRDEMKQFPAGKHDDFVDTGGYAARVQFEDYVPPADSSPPPPPPDQIQQATDVPTGFDPETATW